MAFAVASSDAEQSLMADPLPVCSEQSVLLCYGILRDLRSECAFSAGHSADGAAAARAGGVRAL